MPITIEGPGFSIDFPDGTDNATINRVMSVENAKMKTASRRQADDSAGAFTPNASGDMTVGNASRAFLRGLPFVGQYRDEASAWVRSKMPGGPSYDEALAKERGSDQAFAEQWPLTDLGLGMAGGVMGTLPAAAALGPAGAGGAAGAVGRTAFGLGAETLAGGVARGAASGLAQGAAAGAGAAEGDFVDRGMGAIKGGALGGIIGGGVPALAEGARRPLASIYDKVSGQGDALSRLSGAARNYVQGVASPANIGRMETEIGRLGPQAMLADVSPEFQAIASAAAGRPGGRDTIARPLLDRTSGSNTRLAADLDNSLGQAPIPSHVDKEIAQRARTIGSQYDVIDTQGMAVPTKALDQSLEAMAVNLRGAPRNTVNDVRQMLLIPGTDQLDPNPVAIHNVRQALDGMIGSETNSTSRAYLTKARQKVDELLTQSVPGIKNIDAQYAGVMREKDALQRGASVLDTSRASVVRPAELADELAGMAPEARGQLRQGLRAEIDRVAGTAGNDARAIRTQMRGSESDGDWNPQKLGMVFGDDKARQALGAIDREVTFQNTQQAVTGGSATEPRRQFNKMIDAVESPMTGGLGAGDATLTGLAMNTAKRIHTVLVGAVGQSRANRFASELGEMAVSQGSTRDDFLAAMKRVGLNRAQTERTLNLALKGGLIVSRETPSRVSGMSQP